jgi:hypothetical protein
VVGLLSPSELIRINTGLLQNRPQGPFRHISGMVWDRRIAIGLRAEPDLVAPGRLAIKLKSEYLESTHDFTITESEKPTHSSGHHDCEILIFRCWGQGQGAFAFPPRPNQTASNIAGNLQSLGHSAALRN